VCENHHEHHILDRTIAPAGIAPETARRAVAIAKSIADALDYAGILAVELFLTVEQGQEVIRVNEIAPRVHNSGHWTLDGAVTSQFEQHVRAICGWPLGGTTRHGTHVEMRNLIGDDALAWHEILAESNVSLTLYGKIDARPGRKMGHTTKVFHDT
jgi:5-(carboxyamino)imidazole ribonucleotide synthase